MTTAAKRARKKANHKARKAREAGQVPEVMGLTTESEHAAALTALAAVKKRIKKVIKKDE